MRFIVRILIVALGVLLAASLVPGITVAGFWTALLVALVLAVLNVILGFPLKVLTFPLSVITLGFFLLVVNALVFWAASFVEGFDVAGFWPAFWGALVVTVVSLIGEALTR